MTLCQSYSVKSASVSGEVVGSTTLLRIFDLWWSGVLVVAVEAEEVWGVVPVGVESEWIRREKNADVPSLTEAQLARMLA